MARSKTRRARESQSGLEDSTLKTSGAARREAAENARLVEIAARENAAAARAATSDARFARLFPLLAVALLLLAGSLLFSQLAHEPYSHDEGIHGVYGFDLDAYKYDPVYHGPLLYHLVAIAFHFFGDSDTTGRLVPALLGFGVIALTLFSGRKPATSRTAELRNESEQGSATTRDTARNGAVPDGETETADGLENPASELAAQPAVRDIIPQRAPTSADAGSSLFDVGAGRRAGVSRRAASSPAGNTAFETASTRRAVAALRDGASDVFATWDKRAAFCAAALLSMSPVFVAYSRHLIHDSLVLLLTMGAVLCFQTTRGAGAETRRGALSRLGLAAFLALLVCTKANAFFIIAMLFSAWLCFQLSPRVLARALPLGKRAWPWFVPLGAFVVVGIASISASRAAPGETEAFAAQGKVLALVCVAASLVLWEWMRRDGAPANVSAATETAAENSDFAATVASSATASRTENAVAPRRRFFANARVLAACAILAILIYAFFYGHGYLWLAKWRGGESPWKLYGADLWGRESVLPRMIEYWSGQQKKPRLAGRHDYYIVLLALYELPIVVAALGGVVRAAKQRTPFTDLLIWWSFTSFALYSLANEKVPWLMAHIIVPLALLGGWFLAGKWRELALRAAELREANAASTRADDARFYVPLAACLVGAIFLLRGVIATSFGRPVDQREPLYYAKSSEKYGDAFFAAMRETAGSDGSIWIHPDAAWPSVWYLRKGAPSLGKSAVDWASIISIAKPRLALTHTEAWWKDQYETNKISWPQYATVQFQLRGWKRQTVKFDNWPRASWGALRPDRYVDFWLHRDITFDYDVQTQTTNSFLSEWSFVEFDVCTPPTDAPPQR